MKSNHLQTALCVLLTSIWMDLNQGVIVGPKGTDQSFHEGPIQLQQLAQTN